MVGWVLIPCLRFPKLDIFRTYALIDDDELRWWQFRLHLKGGF